MTFAAGTFPNGWLGGLDIGIGDLGKLINAGFPFVGPLDGTGSITIGPFGGLPTGLQIWGVAVSTATILGNVTAVSKAQDVRHSVNAS